MLLASATMAQPTGTFTYAYDPAGRISNLTNPEGRVTSWSYDPNSRVTAQLLANSVRVSNTYDNADRILLLANLGSGATTLSSFAYTYDPVGNRTQVAEVDGSVVTWSYDPTYQLTNERRSGTNGYNIAYAYDAVGNRNLTINTGAATTYAYNAGNELSTSQTGAGTTTYAFDGDGNLLTWIAPSNQLTTSTWDGENRLAKVALPSGLVNTFTYNADGQRVQKQDSTGTTNQVWDRRNVLLETNAGNIIQVVYSLEPTRFGNLISQSLGGAASFYLFDALGSTRQLTNGAGTVTDQYLYGSFGTVLLSGTTFNRFLYVGRQGYQFGADQSSYYLRARFYDPAFGRFLSRDPAWSDDGQLSLYAYGRNDPVYHVDPSGFGVGFCPVSCDDTAVCEWAEMWIAAHPIKMPYGATVCCGGIAIGCYFPTPGEPQYDFKRNCVLRHEAHHSKVPGTCSRGGRYLATHQPGHQNTEECGAYQATIRCLEESLYSNWCEDKYGKNPAEYKLCQAAFDDFVKFMEQLCHIFCQGPGRLCNYTPKE